jgi:1-acyl-sn-glycerol-3-phosphate acyltransferase
VSGPLTRAGLPRLWGGDRERLWRFARGVVQPITLALAPAAAYGIDRLPRDRGSVIAANHFSGIDHPLIGCFVPGITHFLAKSELFEIPVLGEALDWMGVISIRRGESDRDALRRARDHVRKGDVVVVHVEGTRQRLGYPGPVQTGGLMVAMQEGASIVPLGLDTFGWSPLNRRHCTLVMGEPIDVSGLPRNRIGYGEAAGLVERELVRLWRQAVEATTAGHPPELPDGTRRFGPVRASSRRRRASRTWRGR